MPVRRTISSGFVACPFRGKATVMPMLGFMATLVQDELSQPTTILTVLG